MLDVWRRRTGQPVSATAVVGAVAGVPQASADCAALSAVAWYPTDYFDQPLFTPSRSKRAAAFLSK